MKTYKKTAIHLMYTISLVVLLVASCSKPEKIPPKTERMDNDFVLPPAPVLNDAERDLIELERQALQEEIEKRKG